MEPRLAKMDMKEDSDALEAGATLFPSPKLAELLPLLPAPVTRDGPRRVVSALPRDDAVAGANASQRSAAAEGPRKT